MRCAAVVFMLLALSCRSTTTAPSASPKPPNAESARNVALEVGATFGERGQALGQFDRPQGIAVDRNGEIYVSDTGNNRIQVFDAAGQFLRAFTVGSLGIAVEDGRVYAASGSYIYAFDSDGALLWSSGGGNPFDVEVARDGRLFAAAGREVRVYSHDGVLLDTWGVGILGTAMSLDFGPGDRLYVADLGIGRYPRGSVVVFDRHGRFLERFGDFESATGIAVDRSGLVYLADWYQVRVFDGHGGLVTSTEIPGGSAWRLDLGPDGRVYVACPFSYRIAILETVRRNEIADLGDGPGEGLNRGRFVARPSQFPFALRASLLPRW